MLVDENKKCRQENNLIGSYSVDKNIEDWTNWYGLQPHIGEVIYQITSLWPVFPAAWGRPSVIFRRNATT